MNQSLFLSDDVGSLPQVTVGEDSMASVALDLEIARRSLQIERALRLQQGGLERFQREAHILVDVGSNPIPATNLRPVESRSTPADRAADPASRREHNLMCWPQDFHEPEFKPSSLEAPPTKPACPTTVREFGLGLVDLSNPSPGCTAEEHNAFPNGRWG